MKLDGHLNCFLFSKVTVILVNRGILPSGGVVSRRVCTCSLRSRLVLGTCKQEFIHKAEYQRPKVTIFLAMHTADTAVTGDTLYRPGLAHWPFLYWLYYPLPPCISLVSAKDTSQMVAIHSTALELYKPYRLHILLPSKPCRCAY